MIEQCIALLKQASYMKNHFPFLGLKTPKSKEIQKKLFKSLKIHSFQELEKIVLGLWKLDEREYQYLAIDLASKYKKNNFFSSVFNIRKYVSKNIFLRYFSFLIKSNKRYIMLF